MYARVVCVYKGVSICVSESVCFVYVCVFTCVCVSLCMWYVCGGGLCVSLYVYMSACPCTMPEIEPGLLILRGCQQPFIDIIISCYRCQWLLPYLAVLGLYFGSTRGRILLISSYAVFPGPGGCLARHWCSVNITHVCISAW